MDNMESNYLPVLNIGFKDFENGIIELENSLNKILKQGFNNEKDLEIAFQDKEEVHANVYKFLQNSFSGSINILVSKYKHNSKNIYKIPGVKQEFAQIKDNLTQELINKIQSLIHIRKTVFLSDIIKGDVIDLDKRQSMTISAIQRFILKKLYEVYDDSYYDMKEILEHNGVPMKRMTFDLDLIGTLESHRFIEKVGGLGGYLVRITGEGAKYVEDVIDSKIQLQSEKDLISKISNRETGKLKKHLYQIISKDLEKAFDELDAIIKEDSKLYEDFLLVLGRFGRAKRQKIRGVVLSDDMGIEYNRISEALIDLVGMIQDNDINYSVDT